MMSKAHPETTQAWITEQMQAVLSAADPASVKATMPVILMFMVDAFGIDNLLPEIQDAIRKVFDEAGIRGNMSEKEVGAKMKRYIAARPVDTGLLDRIKEIFDTHYAALNEQKASGLRRFFGARRAPRPATFGAPRPVGTLTAAAFCAGPQRV